MTIDSGARRALVNRAMERLSAQPPTITVRFSEGDSLAGTLVQVDDSGTLSIDSASKVWTVPIDRVAAITT